MGMRLPRPRPKNPGRPRGQGRVPESARLSLGLVVAASVVSEANAREHWAVKHRRKKEQQAAVYAALEAADVFEKIKGITKYAVRLTKLGGKTLDHDNLVGAFKHVIDQIARSLGFDDSDERKSWSFGQVCGDAHGVKIEFDLELPVPKRINL